MTPNSALSPRARALAVALALAAVASPPPCLAGPESVFEGPAFEEDVPRSLREQFGRFSFAIGGGFQYWTLTSLEDSQADRAAQWDLDGFDFSGGDYEANYAYHADAILRIRGPWLARGLIEWTRIRWEDRDREYLPGLGGATRTPVSLSYGTEIRTDPLLFGLGLGHESFWRELRVTGFATAVAAPLKAVDELVAVVGQNTADTESTWESGGMGWAFEGSVLVDWVPDTGMTLFVETFFRAGATTVEPDDPRLESTILPAKREVQLNGIGLRLGVRWI